MIHIEERVDVYVMGVGKKDEGTFCVNCRFNNCYGVVGLLDRLHGTDQLFRASASYHRHKVLFSLYPASKLVPDRCQAGKTF